MSESTNQQQPRFAVQRVYVKDVSFESPGAPGIFAESFQPKVKLDLNSHSQPTGDDRYEVVLTITLTADKPDGGAGYVVEVQQAGMFEIANLEPAQLAQVLGTTCPTLLFPYAREAIDSLVVKGTFAPVNLAPVNFEAVYAEAVRQKAQGAGADANPPH